MSDQRQNTSGALLLPNFGAEEGLDWQSPRSLPACETVASLWRLLFSPATRVLDPAGTESAPEAATQWPASLGSAAEGPVFPWLEDAGGALPWLATQDAIDHLTALSLPLSQTVPSPRSVALLHDKAFAHRIAQSERTLPPSLRRCVEVLEPAQLRAPDAVATIQAKLDAWPTWASRSFTLKPRFGSSGRGRVAGLKACADTPEIRGALPRLSERGGAMLEPWLRRTADLSAQLHLGPEERGGAVVLAGTLTQLVAPSGLFRGHRGQVDSRGRVFSGHDRDEELREAAALVGVEARAQTFVGPCGVDAFEFVTPDSQSGEREFRPLVEFNARFTLGHITTGLVRRALPRLKRQLGLQPGMRLSFVFALAPPPGGWQAALAPLDPEGLLLPLGSATEESGPALLFARQPEALDEVSRKLSG